MLVPGACLFRTGLSGTAPLVSQEHQHARCPLSAARPRLDVRGRARAETRHARRDPSPPLHAHLSALCAPGRPARRRARRLDCPPLLAFECAAAARDCTRVSRRRSRRIGLEVLAAAGARRASAPTRGAAVQKS
eukprot:5524792-Prymnesium_polylepis.1